MNNRLTRILHKLIPAKSSIENHRLCRYFYPRLKCTANYWQFNRRSIARGTAIGLFCSFMLIPFQTSIAFIMALVARANLPLSLSVLWVCNPLTITPMYYLGFKVGAIFLPPEHVITLSTVMDKLEFILPAFFLGTFICGIILGTLGYTLVYCFFYFRSNKAPPSN